MSRSVSTPANAEQIAYAIFEFDWKNEDPSLAPEDFEFCIEGLQEAAIEKYPSLVKADRWLGREDRVVLENHMAAITVSEYESLVAVSAVPLDDSNVLAQRWCRQLDLRVLASFFGEPLNHIGFASNGEQFFRKAGA